LFNNSIYILNTMIEKKYITLVGAGIMSATLGVILKEMNPDFSIDIYERLPIVAAESSDAWNNAGTGHSAFCELNYTPEKEDGNIDIGKAIKIAAAFETSKAFWSYLVNNQYFDYPESFINNIPHISCVWGEEDSKYLEKRFQALCKHELFVGMEFTKELEILKKWMPLMMENQNFNEPIAATKMDIGTDVDFGNLTRVLINHLCTLDDVRLHLNHEVRDLEKLANGRWLMTIHDNLNDENWYEQTEFVFLGAGGGSLPLLEKSNIPEGEGYGGFPVSGQWLVCNNEGIIMKHHAKVYGKASVGAPPMSVPHLDTRIIDGKKSLLFGPFAGFSTKFLKNGSYFDLTSSIEWGNIMPMLGAGWHNLELTKYLIQQVTLSHEDKLEVLKQFYPDAQLEDWDIATAGQRVQVIKKDEEQGGVLEFGTEVITSADGSLAALLGASPGASTSVSVMLHVIEKCFAHEMNSELWKSKLEEMIPMYHDKDITAEEWKTYRAFSNKTLHLDD
jgi:malate dehydrogenase (quinone)